MTTFADLVPSPAGRFDGIERPYSPEDVLRLRGSVPVTHTLAERGANRLWELGRRHRRGPEGHRTRRHAQGQFADHRCFSNVVLVGSVSLWPAVVRSPGMSETRESGSLAPDRGKSRHEPGRFQYTHPQK